MKRSLVHERQSPAKRPTTHAPARRRELYLPGYDAYMPLRSARCPREGCPPDTLRDDDAEGCTVCVHCGLRRPGLLIDYGHEAYADMGPGAGRRAESKPDDPLVERLRVGVCRTLRSNSASGANWRAEYATCWQRGEKSIGSLARVLRLVPAPVVQEALHRWREYCVVRLRDREARDEAGRLLTTAQRSFLRSLQLLGTKGDRDDPRLHSKWARRHEIGPVQVKQALAYAAMPAGGHNRVQEVEAPAVLLWVMRRCAMPYNALDVAPHALQYASVDMLCRRVEAIRERMRWPRVNHFVRVVGEALRLCRVAPVSLSPVFSRVVALVRAYARALLRDPAVHTLRDAAVAGAAFCWVLYQDNESGASGKATGRDFVRWAQLPVSVGTLQSYALQIRTAVPLIERGEVRDAVHAPKPLRSAAEPASVAAVAEEDGEAAWDPGDAAI